MLQFHLDENADFAIAEGLRLHGFNVTSTPPDVPKRTSDSEQLQWCVHNDRVIITKDADMLRASTQGLKHAGIAFYRANSRSYGQLIAKLVILGRRSSPTDFKGCVEYL
jgi:uncharacterized protein with PIN domain